MYESFFGLRERPFDLTPNPRFLVMTDGHREALSNLEYGIASRKGITVLIGDAGTGKTTIIRTALARQTSRVTSVHLNNPALTRMEFVEMLAVRFELSERARESKAAFLLELEALLRARRAADETTVLIIDEAQSLSFELLEEIRLLANIETNDEKLLSLIIAGQPELADQLNQENLRQLKQRVALRCELRPLTLTETLGYIAGRLRAAGGVASNIFTREAVTLLHEHARGIPRAINVLADNALVAGFAHTQRPVTRASVAEVARDFQLDQVVTAHVLDIDGSHAVTATAAPIAVSTGAPIAPEPVVHEASDPAVATVAAASSESSAAPVPPSATGAADVAERPAEEGPELFGRLATKRRRFSILNRWGAA
jgi:general secretion pathway protein A